MPESIVYNRFNKDTWRLVEYEGQFYAVPNVRDGWGQRRQADIKSKPSPAEAWNGVVAKLIRFTLKTPDWQPFNEDDFIEAGAAMQKIRQEEFLLPQSEPQYVRELPKVKPKTYGTIAVDTERESH